MSCLAKDAGFSGANFVTYLVHYILRTIILCMLCCMVDIFYSLMLHIKDLGMVLRNFVLCTMGFVLHAPKPLIMYTTTTLPLCCVVGSMLNILDTLTLYTGLDVAYSWTQGMAHFKCKYCSFAVFYSFCAMCDTHFSQLHNTHFWAPFYMYSCTLCVAHFWAMRLVWYAVLSINLLPLFVATLLLSKGGLARGGVWAWCGGEVFCTYSLRKKKSQLAMYKSRCDTITIVPNVPHNLASS